MCLGCCATCAKVCLQYSGCPGESLWVLNEGATSEEVISDAEEHGVHVIRRIGASRVCFCLLFALSECVHGGCREDG